jgi:hypothetical protein
MSALDFAKQLLSRGIEILVRNNRLWIWPPKAHAHLTSVERTFIDEHREELKELARSHALPEATVVWTPPTATDNGIRQRTPPMEAATSATAKSAPLCAWCGNRPCVGKDSRWYHAFHWNAADEIARRDAEATRLMYHQIGKD